MLSHYANLVKFAFLDCLVKTVKKLSSGTKRIRLYTIDNGLSLLVGLEV